MAKRRRQTHRKRKSGNRTEIAKITDRVPEKYTKPQGRKISISEGQEGIDYNNIFAKVVQCLDIGRIVQNIDIQKEYIVQIPMEFQAGFNNGQYILNENLTTGVLWPALVEVNKDGRRTFAKNLPIVEKEFVQGNPIHDLSMNMYNLATQRQLTAIYEMLGKTYEAVRSIEQGQMDDRIAMFESGKEQIENALTLKDSGARIRAIEAARSTLYDAKHACGSALKTKCERFEPIPDNEWLVYWMVLKDSKALRQKDREVEVVQAYYDLYLEATKLLAMTYIYTNEINAAENTYNNSISFLKEIDFSNVRSIMNIHKQSMKEVKKMFMFHPVEYIRNDKKSLNIERNKYDYLEVNVSGKTLLEAKYYGIQN